MLTHFDAVVLDLHQIYGADIADPALVRPWPWWRERIFGLLSTPSRLLDALRPPPPQASPARRRRT